jgi:hypothetical protein
MRPTGSPPLIWRRTREGTLLWGRAHAVLALIVLFPGRADAEHAPIGLLEVATQGVSETTGDEFEESIERALAAVEVPVVRSKSVREKLATSDFVHGCSFGPCVREVGRATGLERLLVARIEGAGKSYSVVVSLVETGEGRLVSQVAQSCPVCTVDEAIATATRAVVELITRREGEARSEEEVVAVPDDQERIASKKKHVRRLGVVFTATGAAALVGGILLAGNDSDAGAPLVGGGAALASAGIATLLLSVTF